MILFIRFLLSWMLAFGYYRRYLVLERQFPFDLGFGFDRRADRFHHRDDRFFFKQYRLEIFFRLFSVSLSV